MYTFSLFHSIIVFSINLNSPSYSVDYYLPTRLKGSFPAKAYLYVKEKGVFALDRKITMQDFLPAVVWEEEDGMCLQRRRYVGAIFGACATFYRLLHPIAAISRQTQIVVGFSRTICSAMTWY